MTGFKSQYLYIVLICRIILCLFIIGSALAFINLGIPSIWINNSALKAVLLICIGLGLFTYLLLILGTSLLAHRYIIIVQDGKVILKDIVFKKTIILDNSNVRGYSISTYGQRSFLKTLLLYLSNGEIIEFPQFFYANFKEIPNVFEKAGLYYFGFEKYKWRNLLFRDYIFK